MTVPGLLSVVVPAYRVEDYLAECLTSILTQSYADLEVIVVDDGSDDATGAIADAVAATDDRVHVLHQANAGLGAARNIGAFRARGEFLAFADSDDLVLPGAYARLVGSLTATGSDLAIGRVHRFDASATYSLPLVEENHAGLVTRTTVDEHPLALADVFAWNKVFRREFWQRAGLGFPARVSYEDQPTITRALVLGTFDLLPEDVYAWRLREDGTSLSQQRASLSDLVDRFRTKRAATATVERHTCLHTQGQWYARVLPVDMWEYFRSVPGNTEDYWAALRAGTADLWGLHTVPFERTRLPLRQRLMGWLVLEDRREDLEALLTYLDALDGPLPRRQVADRQVVDHPFAGLRHLPPELVRP